MMRKTVLSLVGLGAIGVGRTLAGCGTTTSGNPDSGMTDAPALADGSLGSGFETAGFVVRPGTYGFFDTALCCVLPSCFGNNPSSPYASVSLGGADGGPSSAWQLRQDEAIVVVATTPPSGKYFGYTPYVFDQANDAGGRTQVFASIGDTTNDLVINASANPPFSSTAVLIVTPNETSATRIEGVLAANGYPSSVVNVIPIPTTPDVAIGVDPSSATFSLVQRMALLDDPDAGAAYEASPKVLVFDLLPQTEIAAAPYAAPTFRVPGTGTNESSLQASMTALQSAILAKYATVTAVPLNVAVRTPVQNGQYGYYCIDNATNCLGDNRDAVYGSSDLFAFAATDFVVVYGVNHAATGKATYSNFSIYDAAKLFGVAAVDDRSFGASAAVYVPSDPNVASLYAWTLARDCTGNQYCTVIPTTCPGISDQALQNLAIIATRAYLEPQTKTRPLASELVLDDAIHFKP